AHLGEVLVDGLGLLAADLHLHIAVAPLEAHTGDRALATTGSPPPAVGVGLLGGGGDGDRVGRGQSVRWGRAAGAGIERGRADDAAVVLIFVHSIGLVSGCTWCARCPGFREGSRSGVSLRCRTMRRSDWGVS